MMKSIFFSPLGLARPSLGYSPSSLLRREISSFSFTPSIHHLTLRSTPISYVSAGSASEAGEDPFSDPHNNLNTPPDPCYHPSVFDTTKAETFLLDIFQGCAENKVERVYFKSGKSVLLQYLDFLLLSNLHRFSANLPFKIFYIGKDVVVDEEWIFAESAKLQGQRLVVITSVEAMKKEAMDFSKPALNPCPNVVWVQIPLYGGPTDSVQGISSLYPDVVFLPNPGCWYGLYDYDPLYIPVDFSLMFQEDGFIIPESFFFSRLGSNALAVGEKLVAMFPSSAPNEGVDSIAYSTEED